MAGAQVATFSQTIISFLQRMWRKLRLQTVWKNNLQMFICKGIVWILAWLLKSKGIWTNHVVTKTIRGGTLHGQLRYDQRNSNAAFKNKHTKNYLTYHVCIKHTSANLHVNVYKRCSHPNKVDCEAANSGLIFIKLALFDINPEDWACYCLFVRIKISYRADLTRNPDFDM